MDKTSFSHNIDLHGTEIAKVVLMPGDPLRAKYIAETYLENPVCFNTVRNMLGYTGTYRGRKISVMGSGMGIPSIGLYATELYDQFDVDAIIRIGSAGALTTEAKLRDVVIAMGASTDSNYGEGFDMPGYLAPVASYDLLSRAVEAGRELGLSDRVKVGSVYTSDHFYDPKGITGDKAAALGHLAIEMEVAGLYWTAIGCHKKALGMLTISDHMVTGEKLTVMERQEGFNDMMKIALETAWSFAE